ncbi:MAG: SDR family oxidoreductase [Gemmatimonadaceae bacterium]
MSKRTVLITGCSSGFGRATALEFLKAGWRVAATMRNTSEWHDGEPSEDLLLLELDVENIGSIKAAFAQAVERFGKLDCVVNNAGRGLFSVFEATPMEAVRSLFETNVFGYMQVMQAAMPHFQANGGGRFINVSSGSGIRPEPLMSIYGASKHAIEEFTESVAYELATQNVSVKLIEPGMVKETNFLQHTREISETIPFPSSYQPFVEQIMAMFLGRSPEGLGTEDEVAEAIVAAASDETEELRIQVGCDTAEAARMRWETSETEYSAWTRSMFTATEKAS